MVAAKVQARRKNTLILVALSAIGVLLLSAALVFWSRNSEGTILSQAEWPWGRLVYATAPMGPKLLAVRSQEELVQASGLVFDGKGRHQWKEFLKKTFGIETIDFNRRMLVVVVDGPYSTAGYHVEVTKIEPDKEHNALRVHWRLHPPDPGQPPPPSLKYPVYAATVVLLNRFDGEIRLEPLDDADSQSVEPKTP